MESIESGETYYLKFQAVTPFDKSIYFKYVSKLFYFTSLLYQLPCLLGRESSLKVKLHLLNESNNKLSINIPIKRGNIEDEDLREHLKANSVSHKLVLANCDEM